MKQGLLTEWLGTGLQNRRLRFESGRDLKNEKVSYIETVSKKSVISQVTLFNIRK